MRATECYLFELFVTRAVREDEQPVEDHLLRHPVSKDGWCWTNCRHRILGISKVYVDFSRESNFRRAKFANVVSYHAAAR